jgi:hypothetical protein
MFDPGFPIWAPPTRLSVTQYRSGGNPKAFCNVSRADTMILRAGWPSLRPILPFVPCCGRTPPVVGVHSPTLTVDGLDIAAVRDAITESDHRPRRPHRPCRTGRSRCVPLADHGGRHPSGSADLDVRVELAAARFSISRPSPCHFPTIAVVGLGVVVGEMPLAEQGVTCMLNGVDGAPVVLTAHAGKAWPTPRMPAVLAAHTGTRGAWAQPGKWRRPGRTAAVGAVCGDMGLVVPGAHHGGGHHRDRADPDGHVELAAARFSMVRPSPCHSPTITAVGLDVVAVRDVARRE